MSGHPPPWRVGRKVGRTIYDTSQGEDGALIGVMDTPELAARVVEAVNASTTRQADEDER